MEDPHRIDMAYHGMVDYRPQPIGVSTFCLSCIWPSLTNDTREIGFCSPIHISRCRTRARYPCASPTQCPSRYQPEFPPYITNLVSFRQENREYALFPYPPPYLAPDPARVAFPHLFVNQVPAPDQPGAERLRRLAGRYLNQLDSQVGRLCMEPVAAGRFKVVIELETSDVLF